MLPRGEKQTNSAQTRSGSGEMAMGVSGDVRVAWQTRRKTEIYTDEEKKSNCQ